MGWGTTVAFFWGGRGGRGGGWGVFSACQREGGTGEGRGGEKGRFWGGAGYLKKKKKSFDVAETVVNDELLPSSMPSLQASSRSSWQQSSSLPSSWRHPYRSSSFNAYSCALCDVA